MNLKISYHIHFNYNFVEALFGFPKYSIEEKEMKKMKEVLVKSVVEFIRKMDAIDWKYELLGKSK
jgi:hypothetical protein